MVDVNMRWRLLIATALAAAPVAGCVVGDGTGSAAGMLWMLGCLEGGDDGTMNAPAPYDLQPKYFVGEPIEDLSSPPTNRLIIRMQHNGNAPEITDTLYFDIPNSREVAQCLRGETVNGVPLGWSNSPTDVGTVFPGVMGPWCEPPVAPADGGSGLPRIHLVPGGPVKVSFTPLGTCVSTQHPPAIVTITGVAQDGWIDFLDFGSAYENTLPPDARFPVEPDFKVDFGDRLRATFNITLMGDDRVLTAIIAGDNVPPEAVIGGTLQGNFDFNLARGQGGQTFP
jgi:hypothetical protein